MEQKITSVMSKHYLYAVLSMLSGIILDQYTKYLAALHLKDQEPFIIIKGVFQLQYLENRGAAFGMMQNKQYFFVIGALFVVFLLGWWYGKIPFTRHFLPVRICAVLICSGALGNMIDRIFHQYVIDFFYFELIDFPIFNVADIYVVVACFLFVFLIFFYYKEEDFEMIIPKKKEQQTS